MMPQDTGVGRNVVLDGLDFASLRRVWEQTFGATPLSSLARVFLCRVLAYERQCRTHGGLSAVLPPSSVATPCLNANVSWPACVGVHTKVSLNVRHRVVGPARIAERTASPEIRLKL